MPTSNMPTSEDSGLEVQQKVKLTMEMLRSMYAEVVCREGPELAPGGYNTIADITRILQVLQIPKTDLVKPPHSSIEVTTNAHGRRLIVDCVEQNRNRIYLSQNMAKALYVEVGRRYGIGSPQYQSMENLNNDPHPNKIRRALKLLNMPIAEEDIEFTKYQGYVAKFANNDQINALLVLEKQNNLFQITPEKERIIYEKVTAAGMGDSLADLSNNPDPQKLELALDLLGLDINNISFCGTDGYLIPVTDMQRRILNSIENYNSSILVNKAMVAGRGIRERSHRHYLVSEAFINGTLFAVAGGEPEYGATAPAPTGQGDARTAVHSTSPAANFPGGGPGLFTPQRPFASAGPSTHAAVDTGDFQVQRVAAFRSDSHAPLGDPSAVAIYCPQEVLNAFRGLMQGQPILGRSFLNPYTKQMEQIPVNAAHLTVRHLQILARNERENGDGIMRTHLYCNLMDDNAIASIRCLVKATTVGGKVSVARYGGYPANTISIDHPSGVEAIIVDQAGLQWQGDLRNTGGMLFYPDNMEATGVPAGYADWQNRMFFAMYGEERPANFSANALETNWNGVRGHLDLDLVKKAITSEFRQALDSVVDQANANTPAGTRINFRFLKAGMGFFASGLHFPNGSDQQQHLALARMEGIRDALRQIQALDPAERSAVVGKIGRLEFPFSDGDVIAAGCITEIRNIVVGIGLEWGGAGNVDSTSPAPEGYINALTNCADPHAMPGNEGGYQSVDAAISTNARVDLLNVAYNERAQCKINSRPSVAHAAAITAVAAPATPLAEEGGVDLVAGLNLARQHCLHKILQQFAVDDMAPGQWFRLDQSVVEIRMDGWEFGRGRHTGLLAFSNGDYHLEFSADGNNVILLDKRAGFQEITGDQRQVILQTVYDNFPVEVVAPAAAVVMPVPEENADTYEAEIQQAKEHCLRNLGGELSRGTWICLDPDLFGFNLAEWEFGRGSSTNRVGIASASHHIDFMDDGSINVLDKNNNYAQITGAERTNILRTVANAFGDEMKAAPRTMSP